MIEQRMTHPLIDRPGRVTKTKGQPSAEFRRNRLTNTIRMAEIKLAVSFEVYLNLKQANAILELLED